MNLPKFNSLIKMPEAAHGVGNENWYQQVYSKMPIWALRQKACGFFLRSITKNARRCLCKHLRWREGRKLLETKGKNICTSGPQLCGQIQKAHIHTHLCLTSLIKRFTGKDHKRESRQKKVLYLSMRTDTRQQCYSRMNYHWRKTWWQHLKNISATTTGSYYFSLHCRFSESCNKCGIRRTNVNENTPKHFCPKPICCQITKKTLNNIRLD